MRYFVEFEVQSDLGAAALSGSVYKAIVSAFGRIDRFRIAQSGGTYVGYLQRNGTLIWSEVHPERTSDE